MSLHLPSLTSCHLHLRPPVSSGCSSGLSHAPLSMPRCQQQGHMHVTQPLSPTLPCHSNLSLASDVFVTCQMAALLVHRLPLTCSCLSHRTCSPPWSSVRHLSSSPALPVLCHHLPSALAKATRPPGHVCPLQVTSCTLLEGRHKDQAAALPDRMVRHVRVERGDHPHDRANVSILLDLHQVGRGTELRGLVDVQHRDSHNGLVPEGAQVHEPRVHELVEGLHHDSVHSL